VIFYELSKGTATDSGLATVRRVVSKLLGRGADTVLLACTDLTLISDRLEGLPVVDTTVLHARAAGELAVDRQSLTESARDAARTS